MFLTAASNFCAISRSFGAAGIGHGSVQVRWIRFFWTRDWGGIIVDRWPEDGKRAGSRPGKGRGETRGDGERPEANRSPPGEVAAGHGPVTLTRPENEGPYCVPPGDPWILFPGSWASNFTGWKSGETLRWRTWWRPSSRYGDPSKPNWTMP